MLSNYFFKTSTNYLSFRVILNSDGSKDEMFIRHNRLLGDNKEMVEEIVLKAISNDQVGEFKYKFDDR